MRMPLLVLVFLALLGAESSSLAGKDSRPNIVYLMSDDQCFHSLGCYGAPGAKTPHLDQLARDGIAFDHHYDTTAICMACRATVMTGMLEYKTGCNFDRGPLLQQDWEQSYPVLLKKAGYRTAFAGKFGFEVATSKQAKPQMPKGDFDVWAGGPGQTSYVTSQNPALARYAKEYPHSTLAYGAFGADFIRESAQRGQPFCLSISFKAPHQPVTPDPRFNEVYAGASFLKPENFGREKGLHFSEQSRLGRQYERFHSWHYSDDYDGVMAKYYQLIYAIDQAVGMIRAAIEQAGVQNQTVVIFTSDNGYLCGAHGYGSKVLPYEEASRVPLIIFDPQAPAEKAGTRIAALTGNVDFHPTILELAGIPIPKQVDGRSLIPLWRGNVDKIHQSLPLINVWGPEEVHSLAVVTEHDKFIFWPYQNETIKPAEEFYRLDRDPLELNNCLDDPDSRSQLQHTRKEYQHWVKHWQHEGVKRYGYEEMIRKFADLP